jgi:membrane protease YdiL (CAAX protease family)
MRTLSLWATALVFAGPSFQLFGRSDLGMASAIVVGSGLLYGLVVPRVSGLRLQDAGWSRLRIYPAFNGAFIGLLFAFTLWPTSAWTRLISAPVRAVDLVSLALLAVAAGWQQETLFRGFLQSILKRGDGERVEGAVLCQAALFAAVPPVVALGRSIVAAGVPSADYQRLVGWQVGFHMITGLVFGHMREYYGNLLPSYIAAVTYTVLGGLMSRPG